MFVYADNMYVKFYACEIGILNTKYVISLTQVEYCSATIFIRFSPYLIAERITNRTIKESAYKFYEINIKKKFSTLK